MMFGLRFLTLVALVSANNSPDEIEITMDNAALIVEKLCSDIKEEASRIIDDASESTVIVYKAEKIRKAAESCLEAAGRTEKVMPKLANILEEEIEFLEEGSENASENLQKEIMAVDKVGLHLYTKFQSDSDKFKMLSLEIKALAEKDDLESVVNATKVIEAKAEALETLYDRFDQKLDTSVEEIEEDLDEKTGGEGGEEEEEEEEEGEVDEEDAE